MRIQVIASILALTGTLAAAGSVEQSLRPMSRSAEKDVVSRNAVSLISMIAPQNSLRPTLRPAVSPEPETLVPAATEAGFADWISRFRERALRQGISGAVFERAFRGVSYDADVIRRDRNQSEFTKTIWDYLTAPPLTRGSATDGSVAQALFADLRDRGAIRRRQRRRRGDLGAGVRSWHVSRVKPGYQFGPDYIIPTPFDPRLIWYIPPFVAQAAMDTGVARKPIEDMDAYRTQLRSRLDPSAALMQNISSGRTIRQMRLPRRSNCLARNGWAKARLGGLR